MRGFLGTDTALKKFYKNGGKINDSKIHRQNKIS